MKLKLLQRNPSIFKKISRQYKVEFSYLSSETRPSSQISITVFFPKIQYACLDDTNLGNVGKRYAGAKNL